LGAAVFDGSTSRCARLRVRGGELTVAVDGRSVAVPADPHGDTPGWLTQTRIEASCDGRSVRVSLEDLDPFRDCHNEAVTGRLTATEIALWQELLDGAWRLLVRCAPQRAEELTAGLTALVPLSHRAGQPGLSVTSEDAFGGFALTRPASPAMFAATLVHEYQHAKLSALLRLVRLYDRTTDARFYAPWRDDPRPPGALLHGVYAFLGVVDVWRSMRRAADVSPLAERHFATLREQVRHGAHTLARSGCLTPVGEEFLAGMRTELDAMLAEPVPPHLIRHARRALVRDRVRWHLRNRVLPGSVWAGSRRV
jgi:HEXXH motif-containing protein